MAKVADSILWATHEVALKSYLKVVDASEDVFLQRWLLAAVAAADRFLKNTFEDEDGVDIAIPSEVETGVFEFVRLLRETSERPFGLTNKRVGDLSESYAIESRISGGVVTPRSILDAVKSWWTTDRKKVWT